VTIGGATWRNTKHITDRERNIRQKIAKNCGCGPISSHPKSLTIKEVVIEYLRIHKEALVDDMIRDLGISRRSVRRVLTDLEDAGLARRVYDGRIDYDVVWTGD